MSEEPKYFDRIEEYLEGDMSHEERERFEQELKSNPVLAEEFELYKSIGKGISEHYASDELKQKLKNLDEELDRGDRKKQPVPLFPYRWLAAAAVVIVLLISGIVIYKTYYATSLDKIALQYWEEDRGLPVLMGSQNALDNAMNLYKEKQYSESLRELEHLLANHSGNDTLNYYAGVVSFKLGQYSDAEKYFSVVANITGKRAEPIEEEDSIIGKIPPDSANSAFKESAEYREALSNLLLGNKDTASGILRRIASNNSHLYHKQAKEILQSVNS